ncbi:hypothetical protein CIB95_12910 [Lottiidibacillus patelloidae]|uniref:DinB-like domain-containing protein n=1 Tax=Lottiidibacillus patelloidae TaxID=2670334 RepID=A0A263BRH3_9BACI|nr:DinB family protein [Lottiidibacillus patelloidae]OZM56309.1 hypothetical protein CIB95_12910 [Lottiidibacillus patelloidae]
MEKQLYKQLEFVRFQTIKLLESTTEELADQIPTGFNNNIRWNLGHIYVSLDNLLYSHLGEEPEISDDYFNMFHFNTSPADWKDKPPTLEELKEKLVSQEKRIKETFTGRLNEQGEKPFNLGVVQLDSLAEVLNFALWHEGTHRGTIIAIKRALGVEDIWVKG